MASEAHAFSTPLKPCCLPLVLSGSPAGLRLGMLAQQPAGIGDDAPSPASCPSRSRLPRSLAFELTASVVFCGWVFCSSPGAGMTGRSISLGWYANRVMLIPKRISAGITMRRCRPARKSPERVVASLSLSVQPARNRPQCPYSAPLTPLKYRLLYRRSAGVFCVPERLVPSLMAPECPEGLFPITNSPEKATTLVG